MFFVIQNDCHEKQKVFHLPKTDGAEFCLNAKGEKLWLGKRTLIAVHKNNY